MSTKDLFNKSNKVLTKSQVEKAKKDLESEELVGEVVKTNNKFLSHVDYSKPENFAFYGSAQKYYEDSFDRVCKTYPYDGSQKEKQQWINNSSELDLWIYQKAYPKTTGHVRLSTNQSIVVTGGPNKDPNTTTNQKEELSKQFPTKQGKSNVWDPSLYRNSNLYIDGTLGNTIEFWAKLEASVSGDVYPVVVGNESGNRIQVQFNTTTNLVSLVYTDDADVGLSGVSGETTITDLLGTTWAHYAFSFINSGSNVKAEVYKNGTIVGTITSGTNLGTVSQKTTYLRANGTAASTNTVNGLYLDEFRFWKRVRTAEEIGRYWHTNVSGGTNTDNDNYNTENRKVDLGVYYKFNEGITTDVTIDAKVLDYSGRISNGSITNYAASVRFTTSALDEYLDSNGEPLRTKEEKDPVIYSDHPDFVAALSEYRSIGLVHDLSNNSGIFHTIPNWITDEDTNSEGRIKEISQVISSYFDSAQIQIQELTNLQEKKYNSLETDNDKPFFLVRKNLESQGFDTPDLFTEASAFEEILSRNDTSEFEEKLQDVKNTIYQNIYNNLSYIYKSKGTEKAFRNLIRCFGIDDELVKINMYSDGEDYLLEDSRRTTAIKKRFVDFNNESRDQGLVYTKEDPSNANSTSYIRGINNGIEPNLSFTFETEIIFPKRLSTDHPEYIAPTNLEEHIAYLGEYTTSYSANELFDLKAVKEDSDVYSENVKFVLTMDGQTLETQFFKSVYENSKWNLAVRLVPKKSLSGVVSGGSTTDYRAELYCVRMLADVVEDEQLVTADITEVNARALLAKDKYVSIGALHSSGDPETVSPSPEETRVKISSTLFWYDNVTNEEIKAHASDASNFGRLHPSEEAYMFDSEFNTNTSSAIQVLRRDTLAMHWDFSEVSTTDGSGEFIVNDLSGDVERSSILMNSKAIQFDGDITAAQTDHIFISDSDSLSFTDGSGNDEAFSISAWVYIEDASGGDNGPILSKAEVIGGTSGETEYIFKHQSGRLRMFLYSGSGTGNSVNVLANSAGITNATWHNVVMTYDGSNSGAGVTLYVDGVQQASVVSNSGTYSGMTNTSIPVLIGRTSNDPPNDNQAYEDKIADTCVFNKELTQAEVTEIYNDNAVKNMYRFSDYDSIISWWKMGDDQDTIGSNGIKDYKGNNNGTLTNGASIVSEAGLGSDTVTDGRFGWFTDLVGHQVTGRGLHFENNDTQVINTEFVYSAKHRTPEVINSEELIQIRSQDDIAFSKDASVTTHFFAAEKSMYQVISDDMINLFATIVEFNDLIGQPVNRYRMQYKSLEKFRARYFEKVKNVPSLEKYIELYKWIDSSIGMMIQQLIPVSSNFSADLRNMVESHVLERNKYWTKFPTMEMSGEPPMGVMRGINELTYNWKEGHAPVGSETTENDKFLWGDKRVNASDITTGDSTVDDNREILRKVATRTTEGMVQVVDRGVAPTKNYVEESKPILRTAAGATYEGRTYANRALSKPYKLNLDITKNVHGGVNYSAKTKDPNAFIRAATRIIPGSATVGIAATLATNPVTYEEWKKLYTVKRTVTVTISDTELSLTSNFDGDTIYPYYGYRDRDAGIDTTAIISGHHNDSYGDDAEIPMQGPFTEAWVGGNQHRHVNLFTENGEITKSLTFTGSSAITIPDSDSLEFTDIGGTGNNVAFTLAMWVKKEATQAGAKYLLNKGSSYRFSIIDGTKLRLDLKDTDPQQFYYFSANCLSATNDWDHVAVTYDPASPATNDIKFYANGSLITTGSSGASLDELVDTADSLILGAFLQSGDGGVNARLRDAVIFKHTVSQPPLTLSEITELYQNKVATHSRVSEISGWWRLHTDATATIGDNGTSYESNAATSLQANEEVVGTFRPELYLDDSGILKHPQEVDSNYSAARYTRDEVAKRPVNIRNIKTEIGVIKTASYNFEGDTIGSTPSGWYFVSAPTVQQDNAATNKALSFLGTSVALPAEEVGNFGSSSHWRVASIDRGFEGPLNISFKAYEGRSGGNYGITNTPESTDKLWLQYSTDGVTWTTAGDALSSGDLGSYDLTEVEREISQEGVIYLRWVNSVSSAHPGDNWAIDDISISFSSISFSVDDRLLGNYKRDYEVVQTSGRTQNNRWFIKNEGVISNAFTPSPYVLGAADFSLPNRDEYPDGTKFGKTEHVFVERFSAPGDPLTLSRGYLDRVAEEFSVYNSINYRNLEDRVAQLQRLSSHSAVYEGSQGFEPGTNGLVNIHKVNRNIKHDLLGKNHNNAFVSHQIPRSDYQYNIEMLSDADFTISDFSTNGTSVPSDPSVAGFDFVIQAHPEPIRSKFTICFEVTEGASTVTGENLYFQYKLGTGDWTTLEVFAQSAGNSEYSRELDLGQNYDNPLYIRWVARKAQTSGNGEWSVQNIRVKQVSFQSYLESTEVVNGLSSYSDYQGAGYRFIRNVENPAVINQRKKNTYSQLNRTDNSSRESQSTSYIEPAVSWNKPNIHHILGEQHDTLIREGRVDMNPIRLETRKRTIRENSNPISYSYSNNLETFSNQDLADAIDLEVVSSSQFSDTLFDVFSKAELLFSHSVAREIIFPKHKNVGLGKTRTRTKFDTYKFFWKDEFIDRLKCDRTNALGYTTTLEFRKMFLQEFSVDVVDNFSYFASNPNGTNYSAVGDLTYLGEDRMRHLVTRKDKDPLHTSASFDADGITGLCELPTSPSGIFPVYSSVEIEKQKMAPIPSPQLYHNPYNEEYMESAGWVNRKALISKQKPTYNDYYSYSEEVKLAAQNYGLVSEFRISDHMDHYILTHGGNFRAKNYDFLSLDGASHDGTTHTRTSGDSTSETSSFYSIRKDESAFSVTSYPTSSTDDTLVDNNAQGYYGFNPIHAPSDSNFVISNSVNSEIEINTTNASNYIPFLPPQSGLNAAAKFNLTGSSNEYLRVDFDKINADTASGSTNSLLILRHGNLPSFRRDSMTVSLWAQPESIQSGVEGQTNFGLWSMGNSYVTTDAGNANISLLSKYNYPDGEAGHQDFGLTFVVSDGDTDGFTTFESNPGVSADQDAYTSVYTFYKADGTKAELTSEKMNSVIFQLIVPNTEQASAPYLIKAWLNGEELYGVHIREFSKVTARGGANKSINAYSPCPIGNQPTPDSSDDYPWFTDYDTSVGWNGSVSNGLKQMSAVKEVMIGNANYVDSIAKSGTQDRRFRGLIDEFSVFTGILPSSSIKAIYNNGIPNNVGELVANNQVVGNTLTLGFSTANIGLGITVPVLAHVDNSEFDLDNSKSVEIIAGTVDPDITPIDFSTSHYTPAEQLALGDLRLPVWHRIGVPNYTAETISRAWDSEFFNSYVHTDGIRFIEKSSKKHEALGVETTERVKLKVNAIKKLLPYQGFYPQDRTTQLAGLFAEKIKKDIIVEDNDVIYKEQSIQAAMQHFFAPGILYNSIKSGVACDWASYTNETGLEPSYFGDTVTAYDSNGLPSSRVLKDPAPLWYLRPAASARLNPTSESHRTSTNASLFPSTGSIVHLYGTNVYDPNNDVATGYGFETRNLLISKQPNLRLPFEAILDPYKYLTGADNDRYDAGNSVFIDEKKNQFYLMKPSYYKEIAKWNQGFDTSGGLNNAGNYKKLAYPSFQINTQSQNKDFRYELAANNFISEATAFFIKDERLSSIASSPESSFKAMTSGSTYIMDIVLRKDESLKIVNSPGSLGGRYFGPPHSYVGNDSSSPQAIYNQVAETVADPAYAPYTPPYFYGESRVRISFTAERDGVHTLGEIQAGSTVTEVDSRGQKDVFRSKALEVTAISSEGAPQDPTDGKYELSSSWLSKMPLSSSIELFGLTKTSRIESDVEGNTISVSSANTTELDSWVIYSKFECPILDFSDDKNSSSEANLDQLGIDGKSPALTPERTITRGGRVFSFQHLRYSNTERYTVDARTGSGIWAGYGQPTDEKFVTMSIEKVKIPGKKSLIDVCGFTQETKQVGKIADEKEITEAVIMIPFLDEPAFVQRTMANGGSVQSYATINVDDKNFIKIDTLEYRRQMRTLDKGEVIYTNESGEEVRETSITGMIEGMRKYNVPPLYDFQTFNRDPFIMYFFEFKHTLDREDLSNIWQGVQPKIAKEASLDSAEIDHEINPHEFFGNMGELPEGIRWMTFKVKRKAEKSYYKMTQDSRDDSRFKFDFDIGTKEPEYGYNYPYDYFTMLELIQVEANSEKEIDPVEQYGQLSEDEE